MTKNEKTDETVHINGSEEEPSNIVNIHDPFFLWGLLEHTDQGIIQAMKTFSEDDLSRLYWSCHFHKRSTVCDYILKRYESVRVAHEAIETLSAVSKEPDDQSPELSQVPVPFRLPTSPNFIVHALCDGSFIPSKGKPLKFTAVSEKGKRKTCIYKHGDELLQDALCVAVMKEMNSIFEEEHIDAEVVLYEVLPVDKTEGLIECVDKAHPFLEFKNADADKSSNSSDALKQFIEQSPERKKNLFRSFLGFVVSGIVLQLADRHDDNIMVTDDGKILHIDFGCAFGQKTKLERLLGIFMDIPHSPFSEDVFIAMIGRDDDEAMISQLWQEIKDRLWLCFDALRIHKNRFKCIEEKDKHFHERLMIAMNDDEARQAFDAEVEKCYNNRFNAARSFYYQLQQTIVS